MAWNLQEKSLLRVAEMREAWKMTSMLPKQIDLEPLDVSLLATMYPCTFEHNGGDKPHQTQKRINEALNSLDSNDLKCFDNVSSLLI